MKTETVIEPNVEISTLQKNLLLELSSLLPNSQIELVGAMAVPMAGRSEIDIMVLSENIEDDSRLIVEAGYSKGPAENGISYFKKIQNDIEIGIQIMLHDHNMVGVHRFIISRLQTDETLRRTYEDFKKTLTGLSPEEYKKKKGSWIRENLLTKAELYLGKVVNVKIDRPKGSKHPQHSFIYDSNYGFIPDTLSPDGEELDAYVLNVDEPVETFKGKCVAIIHRTNDDDDKLIIIPKEVDNISDEEIWKQTNFQEQFFESVIVR